MGNSGRSCLAAEAVRRRGRCGFLAWQKRDIRYGRLPTVFFFVMILGLWPTSATEASDWRTITTAEQLWSAHPTTVTRLFSEINLNYTGLGTVRSYVNQNNYPLALRALIQYYRNGSGWQDTYRNMSSKSSDITRANKILQDIYTYNTVEGKVPRNADGGLNWSYQGPNNDPEFGYSLNRQRDWLFLMYVFHQTGDARYVNHLDYLIRDWTIHNPVPSAKVHTRQWRELEAALRLSDPWPKVFYRMLKLNTLSEAGAILMLAQMVDHGKYVKSYHASSHNHATMEMHGLLHLALAFPEFKLSPSWSEYAQTTVDSELTKQFYADGVQKELTSHYHEVSVRYFEQFQNLLKLVGRPVSPLLRQQMEAAWNYLATSMSPRGEGPLNNDSDVINYQIRVKTRSTEFNRPDWLYVATNGSEGKVPSGLPTTVFPWAGQIISRSGWDRDAHWSFFDVGPWGLAHQHNDKLHLSVSAYGRDLLVDTGRYNYVGTYVPTSWRVAYFRHSRGHNVILVDGEGQGIDRYTSSRAFSNYSVQEKFDFAIQDTQGHLQDTRSLIPNAKHTRAVVYLRGRYWVVFDRIDTTGSRLINPLWHFHPDVTVSSSGNQVFSNDSGKGNLRIKPIATVPWAVDLVKGQESPHFQGWYSSKYNVKESSSCAVYRTTINGSRMFAWLIIPGQGAVANPTVQVISETGGVLHVRINDGTAVDVVVNMTGAAGAIALPGGYQFEGSAAIVGLAPQPLVALGKLIGSTVVRPNAPAALELQ